MRCSSNRYSLLRRVALNRVAAVYLGAAKPGEDGWLRHVLFYTAPGVYAVYTSPRVDTLPIRWTRLREDDLEILKVIADASTFVVTGSELSELIDAVLDVTLSLLRPR